METKQVIKIPMKVHSRNQIDKFHWSKKSKLRDAYTVYVRQQMKLHKMAPAKNDDVYDVGITVCRIRKIRDHDNLVGGCKQLLDALTRAKFIWDDGTDCIGEPNISQYKLTADEKKEGDYILISRLPVATMHQWTGLPTLAEAMEEQGRKKSWLAKIMVCENSTVTRWIQTNEIPLIKRKKIEEVLGVKIKENIS